MLRGVIFDLFDTLVPFSISEWEDLSAKMARLLFPSDAGRFVEEWREWTAARMVGDLEAVIREVCAKLGISPAVAAVAEALRVNRACHEAWLAKPRPDARAVLAEVRHRGLRTGLISNCSSSVPDSWPASPLGRLVDIAVFSSDEGLAKPDPRIYQIALDRLGLRAAECLYVDDSVRALDGAATVGLRAIQFHSEGVGEDQWPGTAVRSLTAVLEFAPAVRG